MAYNNNPNLPGGTHPNTIGGTHNTVGGTHNPAGMATYGDSAASGPAKHTAGHHKHDLLNKLDPSVDSSRDKVVLPPPGTATNGPHSSRLANKLDPTVDTKAYEGAHLGTAQASSAYQQAGVPTHHGLTTGAPEGTYGPHGSRMANAADPRVDSDRDGRGAMHGAGAGYGHEGVGTAGYGAAHAAPVGGIAHTAGGLGHSSHQQHGVGAGAGYGHQAGVGHGHAAGSMLPGPAPNTAGPHKSDILNKLDPSVDSKGGMMDERGQRRI